MNKRRPDNEARISRGDDQTIRMQRDALRDAGCEKVYEETASGGRWDRPMLHRMLENLEEGDVVVVWKLDRLSRSLRDLLVLLERFNEAGAGFCLSPKLSTPRQQGDA